MEGQQLRGDVGLVSKRPRKRLEARLFTFLSQEWCGNEHMPLDHESFKWDDMGTRVVAFTNDAHEISFGVMEQWQFSTSRKNFHKVIRWYLGKWIFTEWFGLRRTLWYFLLKRRVQKTNPTSE